MATMGDDLIPGLPGADVLFGLAGNDSIYGEGGNDVLFGDDGNDYLSGGDGDDVLSGGDGHDWINGGWGDDVIQGDAGDDSLVGKHGDDVILGGIGNDTIRGGKGNDALFGGEGDDAIFTSAHASTVEGGDGSDTITVLMKNGADHLLQGGTGADDFLFIQSAKSKISDSTITDFDLGVDDFSVDGIAGADILSTTAASVTEIGGDTVLQLATGDSITFAGVAEADFLAEYGAAPSVTVADFDSLDNNTPISGYLGLTWSDWTSEDYSLFPDVGSVRDAPTSGGTVGVIGGGTVTTASISGSDFALLSGNFMNPTFLPTEGTYDLEVTAYDDGAEVGSVVVSVSDTAPIQHDFNQAVFGSVDEVVFSSLDGQVLTVDDLTFGL